MMTNDPKPAAPVAIDDAALDAAAGGASTDSGTSTLSGPQVLVFYGGGLPNAPEAKKPGRTSFANVVLERG